MNVFFKLKKIIITESMSSLAATFSLTKSFLVQKVVKKVILFK